MGILNLTPDSFYDGGRYLNTQRIAKRIEEMVEEGADIIDIGAESSRPGSGRVPLDVEIERLLPVFERISDFDVQFSIDTHKPEVAQIALEHGFHIINDIYGGGQNGEMFRIAARFQVPIIIMHMRGTPETMQVNPEYYDVIFTLMKYFNERIEAAKLAGLQDDQILIDPGIGFGKRIEDNDQIIWHLEKFKMLGYPIVIGASRKSFLSTDKDPPKSRLAASIAAAAMAMERGADIIRVHDVRDSVKCTKFMARMMQNNAKIT